ncbi:MAG TPA: hypothetical protein VF203_08840 [Burkholderiales bacterium]
MARLVVAIYESRAYAEAACRRLLENGFASEQIRLEGGDSAAPPPHPKLKGMAGVVQRMFSGWLIDDESEHYAHAVRGGKTVLALRARDDAAARKAAAIMSAVRGEIGEPIVSDEVPEPPPTAAVDPSASLDASRTVYGPRIYALPNAPTGWGEPWRGDQDALSGFTRPSEQPQGSTEEARSRAAEEVRVRGPAPKAKKPPQNG